MTQTKWLVFLFMTFSVCTMLSGILEGTYIGGGDNAPVWNDLISTWGQMSFSLSGLWTVLSLPVEIFLCIWDMFIWNYAFFDGSYEVVRWVILYPLSAALAITVILTVASIARGGGG